MLASNTTIIGRQAEQAVVEHLLKNGYEVMSTNWRTRWCEIDIVAKRLEIVYFIEVKYRKTSNYGNGLSYITPKKLRQMHFAVEFWNAKHRWEGDCRLLVASVSGEKYSKINIVSL